MSAVAPANSTVAAIRQKVRRLTASSSESALSTQIIDEAINTFYNQDFPYAIKIDQTRSVYEFFTQPFIDKYPLDVNYNQAMRMPVYVDGILGYFFKDRNDFFNMWPKFPTLYRPINGDGVTTVFNFTIQGPFLRGEVTLGGTDVTGVGIAISDDGNGNLYLQVPNPVVSVPAYGATYQPPSPLAGQPIPGMKNLNTLNPGLNQPTLLGTVNYVTVQFSFDTALGNFTFAAGDVPNLFVSQYQTGRPYSLLFWNNEFTIRPVPRLVHKITVESYLTPVQFMLSTDNPTLKQWWQYLAYGASMEILRERQHMEGVENLMEGFKRQEGLVLERQGCEEIGQRNQTIMSGNIQQQGWNQWGMGGWM